MKHISLIFLVLFSSVITLFAQKKEVKLKLIETTDVHGNFFPYNFIEAKPWAGSMARVHAFVQDERKQYKDNLILIDNGDILQGQPTVYYYNYMDTTSTHFVADAMNFMGYAVGNMGNHDVETGHAVYDRWIKQCNFPILGANIIRTADGSTYLNPYDILERDGVKIAVLGMITPAIPTWLPERLWKGLLFDDMEIQAKKWMKIIKEKENPDIIVGVFHAGKNAMRIADRYNEDASITIAKEVPGFDVVMFGHDHATECSKVVNVNGDSVLVINPANNAFRVGNVDITVTLDKNKVTGKKVEGELTDIREYRVSEEYMTKFAPQYDAVKQFVSKKIGTFTEGISTKPAYFGSSAFIDLIHTLQLKLTGADISFSAPLSFNAEITAGDIYVSDMFNLYKYENMLYTMKLSGKEIKGFLEMSYANWTNRMKSPDDHLLLLKKVGNGKDERSMFVNYSFNFDSAAGIIYTVDVTKPKGNKVNIISMADGTPFDENKVYTVALNSYRGNGGGELLTKGAGIPQDELPKRIVTSTAKDLRYYLMNYIEKEGTLSPKALNQWKFIPEDWVKPATGRDYKLLFGE